MNPVERKSGAHTPTPWRVAGKASGYIMGTDGTGWVQVAVVGAYHDKEIRPFNKDRWDADAALIVRAVNAFDPLVSALERAREELRLIRMKDTDAVYDPGMRIAIDVALSLAKDGTK
jgi:hypothetical protein